MSDPQSRVVRARSEKASEAGLAAEAAAQRKGWAAIRQAKAEPEKPKRKLSAAARKRIKSDKSRSRDLDEVAKGMLELWESGYRRRVAELRAQAAKSGGSGQGFAASGAFTADAFIPPKRSEITVDLKASAEFTAKAEAITTAADAALTQLRAQTIAASQFAGGPAAASPLTALASTDFLGYCKIAEVAEIIPEAFAVGEPLNKLTFDEKLLDRFDGCLLMTGVTAAPPRGRTGS